MSRCRWSCLIALLAASVGHAMAGDHIALVGGTLIDGLGAPPIQDSVVLIDGERITAIGTQSNLPVPSNYRVISTEGMSVLPGLWDMHVHLMLNGHSDYTHWDKTYLNRLADEIMPASAEQLLLAGVTSARDLGAPLEASLSTRQRIRDGIIPGPRLFISGPFIQKKPYPGTEAFRWGVADAKDARRKVQQLAAAGVDVIKLIDQDEMSDDEVAAVVDEAHQHQLPVVAHAHRPEEIRIGLKYGVDNFEHTGLATAPEYPDDVIRAIRERTAQMSKGPLFWTPTVEGLYNYDYVRDHPEALDNNCWQRGLKPDTIADIQQSIAHPEQIGYFQITPLRKVTLARKIEQLRQSGVVLMIGTDSGIPLKFHCQSTWNELDIWVRVMGISPMEAIRGATWWPAVMMKQTSDLGSISVGKYADIVAVKGDVLRYIDLLQRVDLVMKSGKVYKLDGAPVDTATATP
ncbi:Xaa-Pro dipeptidase [Ahniella affigens]|uniref:Xaa-Pro dipeptidase n=1 Tax=Ahniella affigens TaxID=2021234 RepID=A0A2P1PY79_9GAMM|nr:amidohydrolase family protein [Ahniella affigens]AVP99799.1 Xaa-Pro dipeptidase [Ahniella affigens]